MGCPIRAPADRFVFANPRRYSQQVAPIFATGSQGIPRTPFVTFFRFFSKRTLISVLIILVTQFLLFLMSPLLLFSHHAKELLKPVPFIPCIIAQIHVLLCEDNQGIEPFLYFSGTSLYLYTFNVCRLWFVVCRCQTTTPPLH